MSRQTDARNAVWTAIESWPALQDAAGESVFLRRYKFDDDEGPEINPSEDELPAIAIWPEDSRVEQPLHRTHEQPYPLDVLLFTKTWNLETAEQYSEELLKALWQSVATGQTVAEVKRVTGFWPMNHVDVAYERIKAQNTKAILTIVTPTLRLRFDPQAA